MAYSSLFKLDSKNLTSEAEVETRLLYPLFKDLGYSDIFIIPKKQLKPIVVHSGSKKTTIEADFILYRNNKTAKVVVETKDPSKNIQDAWGQAASYALSYNKDKDEADRIRWLLISNGYITSLYPHDSNSPIVTLKLSDFASGTPPYVSLRTYIKFQSDDERKTKDIQFNSISPKELNLLFSKCHDLVWKKEKLSPTDAFFEFCKFIFLKIGEDKKRENDSGKLKSYELPMTIEWLDAQKATSKHPVRDVLFIGLRDELEAQIKIGSKRRIFDISESFKLSADTTRELIKQFQYINLSSIDEDLNGRMFEVFLNAAVRGKELGQYFTPRPLVDFMTRIALDSTNIDINNPPKIIDASCGTAGFLIEAMAYLLAAVRNDTRFTSSQKNILVNEICNNHLFGIEANERVCRIARINMYLHGDGGSHVFHGDGLDGAPSPSDDMSDEKKREVIDHGSKVLEKGFDLVLTNPPFSMTYNSSNEDEKRILSQLDLADGMGSVKSNILFLQRYFNLLKPKGEMLIVLDDTVLNGATHIKVREWIFEKFILLGVHSMPFNAFFKARANIKTSVIHVRKKIDPKEQQGYVFMSISNNIGHDNSLNDTLERNNLNDILSAYLEWKRTGKNDAIVKENQDKFENLECPEQMWLVAPSELSVNRIDAFYYSPELKKLWNDLKSLRSNKSVELKNGSDFVLRSKLSKEQKTKLKNSNEILKYIEIGDVTRYGLITKYITGTIDILPSRGEYQIHSGDILVAINNSSRGTVVMIPTEFDGAICTSGFFVINPKNEEEGHLLWYALRSEACRKQIYYLSQTVGQPELKRDSWEKDFLIPFPTKSREQAIAESIKFQEHLSAILDADKYRWGS